MKIFAVILFCCALCVQQVGATVVFDFEAGTGLLASQQTFTTAKVLGNVFNVTVPGNVTRIGVFDGTKASLDNSFGNGFGGLSIPVAIYQYNGGNWSAVSGTAVTFSPTTLGTYEAATKASFLSVGGAAGVPLGVGTYAVVAANMGLTGSGANTSPYVATGNANEAFNGSLVSITKPTTPGQSFFKDGTTLDLSGITYNTGLPDSPSWFYGAGTFDFQLTPVPEAAQFGLASVAVLGLVFVARCGARARKAKA